MTVQKWFIIIAKIMLLIAGGMSKIKAVDCVAKQYNISKHKIWRHGGF